MISEWTVWSKNIQSPINNIIFEMCYFSACNAAVFIFEKDYSIVID
jgi:hypothetical protein